MDPRQSPITFLSFQQRMTIDSFILRWPKIVVKCLYLGKLVVQDERAAFTFS